MLGGRLELECGTRTFLAIYASGVLGATAMSFRGHLKHGTFAIGASGAICGLLGSVVGAKMRDCPESAALVVAAVVVVPLVVETGLVMLAAKAFHALRNVCHWWVLLRFLCLWRHRTAMHCCRCHPDLSALPPH